MSKKIFMQVVLVLSILSLCSYGFASTGDQRVIEFEGNGIGAAAYVDQGNLYLPLRAIAETLGYSVEWLENVRTINVTGAGKNIIIDLNNYKINADGHDYYMDTDYKIIGDRTYLGEYVFFEGFGLENHWNKQYGPIQLARTQQNAISLKTIKEVSKTGFIEISLQYPQVDGLADRALQERINTVFSKAAGEARDAGLKNAAEMEEYFESGFTGSPNKCETHFDYRLKYNQKGLLSIVCLDYQYTGGAHGQTVQSSYTFNLKTGEEYGLKDLFAGDADYISIINNAVQNEIKTRIAEGILPDHQLEPFETIRADQDFYLSNNTVVVYFQQYEHWPYAAGIQEFPVEVTTLQGILKPEILQILQRI